MYNTIPMIDMNKAGETICALRVQRGLSVRKLQAKLGFATPQAIYKWQQGLTLPSVDNLVALSEILGVSMGEILGVDTPSAAKILPFRAPAAVRAVGGYNPLPIINMVKTGENICALRMSKGLSVRKLQALLGFATPQAIYKWQQGITLPSIDNLVALSVLFEVPMECILVVDMPLVRAS